MTTKMATNDLAEMIDASQARGEEPRSNGAESGEMRADMIAHDRQLMGAAECSACAVCVCVAGDFACWLNIAP